MTYDFNKGTSKPFPQKKKRKKNVNALTANSKHIVELRIKLLLGSVSVSVIFSHSPGKLMKNKCTIKTVPTDIDKFISAWDPNIFKTNS